LQPALLIVEVFTILNQALLLLLNQLLLALL
jgi:hypothetical protein